MLKYTIERCHCCENGWIIRDNEIELPKYHLILDTEKPEIGELPWKKILNVNTISNH